MGETQPGVHNLTELIPFIEPRSHSKPEHNLQVYEVSDQFVDLDGIKHSFNQSFEPPSTNVFALLASSSFTVPQDNFISQLFNELEIEQGVAQETITPRMKECENATPSPAAILREIQQPRERVRPHSVSFSNRPRAI